MLRIRRFELRTTELFKAGAIKGTAHSYAGEEAIAAGTCQSLTPRDYVGSYHRGHGHCIAKGARLDRMMAELMGKATGYCGGLGGSMHIADLELGILGANGIVGAAMPLGVGAALAAKLRNTDQVVVAFFGDGAANQGIFHESLNLASVWRLPIVFVCENNHYALNTAYSATTAVPEIAQRAAAYSMPGVRIDGNDVEEVHVVVGEAIARARTGAGPSLVEAMTWRWGPHSMRANLREPRTDADMQSWLARDPLERSRGRLAAESVRPEDIAAVEQEIDAELEAAIAFAQASNEPSLETARQAVYAPHLAFREPLEKGTRELTSPRRSTKRSTRRWRTIPASS
jgi:2-oxoisovalerate dehydrogenase E1 component